MPEPPKRDEVERVFREERGPVLAALVRATGDLELAEDALQDAFLAAVDAWPRDGVPRLPAAWLTAVAKNRATSVRRHEGVVEGAREIVRVRLDGGGLARELDGDGIPDDRLRLIFCACHPALALEARVALTLQIICGLPTLAIARLFLVSEATIAQRLVRAKRKIREAAIPFAVPAAQHFEEQLEGVLTVVYLLFTEGYAPTDGDLARAAPLCEEAIRLGRVLCHLLPTHGEVRGLLALMLLHDARRAGRVDASGQLAPLDEQNRSRWDSGAIIEGTHHLDEALARGRAGRYQIEAAVAALHATAARAEDTDWVQVMALYEELCRSDPSPAASISLAIAEGMAFSPELGLARLDAMDRAGVLQGSDRVAAARADLLRRAGRTDEARAAYTAALACARNERESLFLRARAQGL